ncbi:hypothetical protein [Streptomyces sp. NRRL S-337]|uniref:hypothetical protein n=1 Tax=Streptomyces sp. NRRL S-337 TaxID=1463900 RepID=UPI0004CB90BE|nr:hypothetical protein [Streptomyces sp. NRRL S-337]
MPPPRGTALVGEGQGGERVATGYVLAMIRGFRHRIIAESTAGWPTEDRAALARPLTRFVRDFEATTTGA